MALETPSRVWPSEHRTDGNPWVEVANDLNYANGIGVGLIENLRMQLPTVSLT
jgi:hypothetical protein